MCGEAPVCDFMESESSDGCEAGLGKKISLICADIDGTLVGSDLKLAPATTDAITEAVGSGVHFVLCSGRMHCSMLPFHQKLGLDTPMISYNGAMARMPGELEPLYHVPLAKDAAEDVIGRYRETAGALLYFIDDAVHVAAESKWSRLYERRCGVRMRIVPDYAERFNGRRPTKVIVMDEPDVLDTVYQKAREHYGDDLHVTKSLPEHLEFLHPKATKGYGVRWMAGHLGIDESETAGMGDVHNDMELLEEAAIGVAMGQAPPELKALAQYVAPPQDEDGAATAIRKLIGRG